MKELRILFSLLIIMTFIIGCEKEDHSQIVDEIEKPQCEHDLTLYHCQYLENGVCSISEFQNFNFENDRIYLQFKKTRTATLIEGIHLRIEKGADLNDTLWIGRNSSSNPDPKVANVFYSYSGSDYTEGGFRFEAGFLSPVNFLIIDYFNKDTTILEGRFQCKFQIRSVNEGVGAPDSLNLTYGRFKVRR